MYDYNGRRSKEAFIEFTKNGFETAPHVDVPSMPSFVEQLQKSMTEPVLAAYNDIQRGRYATPNVFLIAMPLFVLIVLTFAICVIPEPDQKPPTSSKDISKKGD